MSRAGSENLSPVTSKWKLPQHQDTLFFASQYEKQKTQQTPHSSTAKKAQATQPTDKRKIDGKL